MAEMIAAALAGGLIALVAVALVDPAGQLKHIDTAAIAVGVFVGIGLDRLLRG